MNNIRLNYIDYSGSICDGPGIRIVVFLQGCNIRCAGCHNKETWDIQGGYSIDIDDLVEEIVNNSNTKRITISGGEPLLQKEKLIVLIKKLKKLKYDIALYTSYDMEEVPISIINEINYLKCGNFIKENLTTTIPYIGSSNQIFMKV